MSVGIIVMTGALIVLLTARGNFKATTRTKERS